VWTVVQSGASAFEDGPRETEAEKWREKAKLKKMGKHEMMEEERLEDNCMTAARNGS
jgi:hypothetical protein